MTCQYLISKLKMLGQDSGAHNLLHRPRQAGWENPPVGSRAGCICPATWVKGGQNELGPCPFSPTPPSSYLYILCSRTLSLSSLSLSHSQISLTLLSSLSLTLTLVSYLWSLSHFRSHSLFLSRSLTPLAIGIIVIDVISTICVYMDA